MELLSRGHISGHVLDLDRDAFVSARRWPAYDLLMSTDNPTPRTPADAARDAERNAAVARARLLHDRRRAPEERLEMTLRLSSTLIELSQTARRDGRRRP